MIRLVWMRTLQYATVEGAGWNRFSAFGRLASSLALKDKLLQRNYQAMKMLDINQDGYLSIQDYEVGARAYAKATPGIKSETTQRYLDALRKVFEVLGLSSDTDKLTIEEAVDKSTALLNNPEFVKRTKDLYSACFDTLDVDGNGFLSPKEWEGYMASLKFTDPSKGKEIFETMDLNKDGQLSREEFVEMSFEYWNTGTNKLGGERMFGGQ